MAGHSKWNNIKNRKGAVDQKRGKIFTQVAKHIRQAVRSGNSADPNFNPALRLALDKARAANMPKDNVQRAIDRALGKTASGAALQEIVYEGFGPQGTGFMVVAVTDNTNRTASEIRFIFSRHGGSLGSPNSVSYLFSRTPEGEYTSTMPMMITDTEVQQQLQDLIDAFREYEDVEDVYTVAEWDGKE